VYVLTDVGMIYRYFFESDDTVRTLPLIPLTEEPVEQDRAFQSIFVDSNQNLWVSQGYYGVTFVKYGKEDIVVVKPDYASTQRGFINSIVEDKDGNIWFSSDHGGMMPVVDGNELCSRLKSDINTSHIPIILLTAKMMKEDECCGLEAGADDYLTKPFSMSILRLRIAKFIEWKNRSKRIFEKEPAFIRNWSI